MKLILTWERRTASPTVLSAVVLLCITACTGRAADPDPAAAVAAFRQYYAPFERSSFTAKCTSSADANRLPDGQPSTEETHRVWLDGPRWKSVGTTLKRDQQGSKVQTYREDVESLHSEQGLIKVGLVGGRPRGMTAYLGNRSLSERNNTYANPTIYFPVNGSIGGNTIPLPEVLAESSVATGRERLNGVEAVVLRATGKWGEHTVWLDPARGHLPLRVVQVKRPQDLIAPDGKTFGSYGAITQGRQEIETTRVENIQGHPVITGYRIVIRLSYPDSPEWVVRQNVSLSDVRLMENFTRDPIVFTAQIPDGLRVSVQDQLQIRYVWRGGRVVKDVDEESVANLEGNQFLPGKKTWVYWTAGGAAVAVVLGAVYLFVRYYRRPATV